MRFKVDFELEIEDDEILAVINDMREDNDESTYESIGEIPEEMILKFLNENDYIEDDVKYYGEMEKIKVEILK